jgi:hypothetical protein
LAEVFQLTPGLGGAEQEIAMEALLDSRVATWTVQVTNEGQGAAEAELQSPESYKGDKEDLQLEPGERDSWVLDGPIGDDPARVTRFNASWSKEKVVDPGTLKLVAIALLFVVLALVVWDIAGPRGGWHTSSNG